MFNKFSKIAPKKKIVRKTDERGRDKSTRSCMLPNREKSIHMLRDPRLEKAPRFFMLLNTCLQMSQRRDSQNKPVPDTDDEETNKGKSA